jgi:hypothetical protein
MKTLNAFFPAGIEISWGAETRSVVPRSKSLDAEPHTNSFPLSETAAAAAVPLLKLPIAIDLNVKSRLPTNDGYTLTGSTTA